MQSAIREDSPHVERYFQWLYERHLIWYRRMVLRAPGPWTADPILQRYKFTNSFRELDRGSIYSRQRVCMNSVEPSALLMRVITYRIFNKVSTYNTIFEPRNYYSPPMPQEWSWLEVLDALEELNKKESIFTSAHVVSTFGSVKGQSSKVAKVMDALQTIAEHIEEFAQRTKDQDMPTVYRLLQELPGVGEFLAYEICCDLAYSGLWSWDEDTWAHAGPGAREGLKILFPERFPATDALTLMRELQAAQGQYFLRYPMYLIWPRAALFPRLSLRNIEGGLCEYYKYTQAANGNYSHRHNYILGEGYVWK